jgi:hypothetical protein
MWSIDVDAESLCSGERTGPLQDFFCLGPILKTMSCQCVERRERLELRISENTLLRHEVFCRFSDPRTDIVRVYRASMERPGFHVSENIMVRHELFFAAFLTCERSKPLWEVSFTTV